MSDYETIQKRRDMAVGLFVAVALIALFWMVFKFGDLPVIVSEWKSFKILVQFPTASGVQENTPVQFCGYQIGRVTYIRPPEVLRDLKTGNFYHQTAVVLNIDKRYDDIPASVEVKLMTRGLGSSFIELKVPPLDVKKEKVKEFLVDGDVFQGSTGVTSEFFPEESQKKLDELADDLKALTNNANDILGDKANKENLKATLANLSEVTDIWVHTSEELSRTTREMRLILEKVNEGDGSVAKLINDGRLYENLLENSQQMEVLLEEMKLFVKKASEKGVPIKLK